ncbi:MAG TPA: hypothetical protein VK764_02760 [Terracidiphilus sp.]|nr:hypothetical protein [Terracidiphilus sp.]
MRKHRIALLAIAMVLAAIAAPSQSSPSSQLTHLDSLTGVWRGQMDGLPAVTLVISEEGGSLAGAIAFDLHRRATVNDPWTSTPGVPEPMFNLKFDGNALQFQVSHRRAQPPRTLSDPPVSFHLTRTGPEKAELVNDSEPANENARALVLQRSEY